MQKENIGPGSFKSVVTLGQLLERNFAAAEHF